MAQRAAGTAGHGWLRVLRRSLAEVRGWWQADKPHPPELEAVEGRVTPVGHPAVAPRPEPYAVLTLACDRSESPYLGSGAGAGPAIEVELARSAAPFDPEQPHAVTGRLERVRDGDLRQPDRQVAARPVPSLGPPQGRRPLGERRR